MLQALDPQSRTPADVLQSLAKLSDAARERLDPTLNVRAYIDRLCADGLYGDVIDVLTHLLPRQYSVAWGCECLLELSQHVEADPSQKAALAVAQRWLADPSEDNRRAAVELADRLGLKGAGAWLAAAAGWSGGSMLPPGQPEVPVTPTLTGDAVGAALRMAAVAEPMKFEAHLQSFVERALAAFTPEPA